MGFSLNNTRFVVQARQAGVRFDETLTLGRQYMMVSPERIASILREHGLWPPPDGGAPFLAALRANRWRFEVFAQALGAKTVASMDAAAYEQATLIHDLNQPIPEAWHERYDVVIDSGTLEHVFNFPVAVANAMKMVKTGGHLILLTIANNWCGHGFYQFSPELFYRALSPENGFKVSRMIGLEDGVGRSSLLGVTYDFYIRGPWFNVHDPAEIGQRVNLLSRHEASLFVLAKKMAHQPIFEKAPQQNDYVLQWQTGKGLDGALNQSRFGNEVVAWLRQRVSENFYREWLPRLAAVADPFRRWRYRRSRSFANRMFYRRADP